MTACSRWTRVAPDAAGPAWTVESAGAGSSGTALRSGVVLDEATGAGAGERFWQAGARQSSTTQNESA